MRAVRVLSRLVAVGAVLGSTAPVVTGPVAYAADASRPSGPPIACRAIATPDSIGAGSSSTDGSAVPGDPFGEMDIAEATHAGHGQPGAGVTVAVIDSGIDPRVVATPPAKPSFDGQPGLKYFHGTTVAGLIAGRKATGSPGGIAPGVRLLDMPVLRPPTDNDATPRVDGASVINALGYLNAHFGSFRRLIVNLSLEMDPSPALRHEIERLVKRGAIVVAASGNRRADTADGTPSPYVGNEDADDTVYPAAYPGVVAVGAVVTEGTEGDATGSVVANSRTDVVAPTMGARSWTLGETSCVIDEVTTSWSTAEVSGVLALLASTYRNAAAAELVHRLEDTASGRPDVPGRFTGAGVVQAYDAVTRPLAKTAPAKPRTIPQAHVAPPPPDVLESARHAAIWCGLIGGGALLLGLVFRPLFSRRRRS